MTGVIWFVQVVHYPLLERVGVDRFTAYHAAHTRFTTWVVVVPMLVELISGAGLLWWRSEGIPLELAVLGLVFGVAGVGLHDLGSGSVAW